MSVFTSPEQIKAMPFHMEQNKRALRELSSEITESIIAKKFQCKLSGEIYISELGDCSTCVFHDDKWGGTHLTDNPIDTCYYAYRTYKGCEGITWKIKQS